MGKWLIRIVIAILILTPAAGLYLLNYGNPLHKLIANRYVPEYLKKSGYSDEEIAEAHYVEPKNLINKDFYHGHYMVRFMDEPEVVYYYGVAKKGKEVKQFCERDWYGAASGEQKDYYDKTITSKHLENDCVYSLENRKR